MTEDALRRFAARAAEELTRTRALLPDWRAEQSRVLLRSNLANNQYRVWGSLISQAISDVEALP